MPHNSHLKHLIEARATLSRDQARDLMQQILAGQLSEIEIAALLGALAARGETAPELAGFVDAMRSAAIPIPFESEDSGDPAKRALLVDTCGTGGDASHTFNISTAAALVAAAAGATIAKHGNRAVTSLCGSADVLEALGIPVDLTPAQAAQALRRHRFAFLHAPALHPAMKAVMPVRRALGIRTVFNLLGPLTNPAGAAAQVMGVYAAHAVPLVAEAMLLLGVRHAFVVHGAAVSPAETPDESRDTAIRRSVAGSGSAGGWGIDEISISGPTHLAEVHKGTVTLSTLTPEDLNLQRAPLESLTGGDAHINAAILTAIFSGVPGPRRDVVLLNAAAVLVVADLAPDLRTGIALAAKAIDTGAVTELVIQLSTPEERT